MEKDQMLCAVATEPGNSAQFYLEKFPTEQRDSFMTALLTLLSYGTLTRTSAGAFFVKREVMENMMQPSKAASLLALLRRYPSGLTVVELKQKLRSEERRVGKV